MYTCVSMASSVIYCLAVKTDTSLGYHRKTQYSHVARDTTNQFISSIPSFLNLRHKAFGPFLSLL